MVFAPQLESIPKVTIIEIGAGKAVPTVRNQSEYLMASLDATLIRINPREAEGPKGTISVPAGGLAALRRIDAAATALGKSALA